MGSSVETSTTEVAIRGACDHPFSAEDQYHYEMLAAEDEVRVLNLEPANHFRSPLRGSITKYRLKVDSLDPDGCGYSAVSYTWGDSKLSHKLFVRLGSQWTSLPITKNVDVLLRYLRDAHKETPLWIDGICLNQADRGEKAQQVPLMDRIYACANRVHIWLGDDEIEHARQVFSLIRRIELNGIEEVDPGTDEFLSLERFFNRPWFTRRWIIQETFFAHDAVFWCGHQTLSLSRVMAVVANATVQGSSGLAGWGLRMLKATIGLGQTQRARQGLLSLLWDLHESECSEKLDRIAALYSMSDIHGRPPLQYRVGDWQNVYEDVAHHFYNNGTVAAYTILLHLWSFGPIHVDTANEIPTWVPDWSKKRQEQIHIEPGKLSALSGDTVVTSSWSRTVPLRQSLLGLILPSLRSDQKQWKQKHHPPGAQIYGTSIRASLKLQVSGRMLRLDYSFLTFIYGCGIVDEVVHPSRSKDFWEDVVRLATWRKKSSKRNRLRGHLLVHLRGDRFTVRMYEDVSHQEEVQSLASLLISVLAWKDPTAIYGSLGTIKSVMRLCAGVYSNRGNVSKSQVLTDDQKGLLSRFRSAMNDLTILRVQTTIGHNWAIGPPSVAKGDWLTPIITQGHEIHCEPTPTPGPALTPFLLLRPTGPDGQAKVWYPSVLFDLDTRMRHLLALRMPEVEPVHVTARFVGSGGSCIHSWNNFRTDAVLWRILQRATEAAKRRGLPGPIVFDIV